MKDTLRFRIRIIGNETSGVRALLLVLEEVGFAICYTQEEADTLIKEFPEIIEPENQEKIQEIISRITRDNAPSPARDPCHKRVILKNFGGSFVADALIEFIDGKEAEHRHPFIDLTIDPKKFS